MLSRLILPLMLIFVFALQSCNSADTANSSESDTVKANQVTAAAKKNEPKQEKPEELVLVGENLEADFKDLTVQNQNFKDQNMLKLINNSSKKHKTIVFVKPHCIYCENLLKTIASEQGNKKMNSELIIAMDMAHASKDEFTKKYREVSKIDAKWIYDNKNKLNNILHVDAFPRFIVIDENSNIITDQRGLILPEDRASLKGLELPQILDKLCKVTYDWMTKQ